MASRVSEEEDDEDSFSEVYKPFQRSHVTRFCTICGGVQAHDLYAHDEMEKPSCVGAVCCKEGIIEHLEEACEDLRGLLNREIIKEKKDVYWDYELLPETDRNSKLECLNKIREFAKCLHEAPVKYEHMSSKSIYVAYGVLLETYYGMVTQSEMSIDDYAYVWTALMDQKKIRIAMKATRTTPTTKLNGEEK